MSEINLFNRWTVKKSTFWIVVGGVPALCVIVFIFLAIIGPTTGNVYSEVINPLSMDGGYYSKGVGGGEFIEYGYDDSVQGFLAAPEAAPAYDTAAEYDEELSVASTSSTVVIERLIIKEGNININVEDTIATRDAIEALVASLADKGAYVVSISESGRGEGLSPYIYMTIRVPVEDFTRVMDQIADMAVIVIDRNESGQDVTEEYMDLEARIEALEIARDRLLTIMEEAVDTEQLLAAERELAVREAEIASLKGRQKYLAQSAALSRISISLQPYELYEPIDTSWKPAETVRRAVENLIDSLQGFADFLILFGIGVLPWFIIFGLIIWGVIALVRKRKRKKEARGKEA